MIVPQWWGKTPFVLALSLAITSLAQGAEDGIPSAELRTAIDRGLARIQQGAASYLRHRECFSCHHQAMPIFAMTLARRRGFDVPNDAIAAQVSFTIDTFRPKIKSLRRGRGIGGAATTVGYALAALKAADYPADDTTDAMVEYLVERQRADGSWKVSARRPPSEASSITTTAMAIRGLQAYGRKGSAREEDASAERIAAAIADGRQWLLSQEPKDTEEHVFRLIGLWYASADDAELAAARQRLIQKQRPDGGWSQTPDLASDAYATGTALAALHLVGLSPHSRSYQKGVRFLLRTQRDDGAWIVETRSRPIQTFFDNGDPGGRSQFISFVATNWAVIALLNSWETEDE